MPVNILMPALSPTMEKGNLAKWLKKEGDKVKAGDVLAEIETDKATMEFEAIDDGTMGKILVPEGTADVAINQPIAILLQEGEDKSALGKAAPASGASAGPAPSKASGKQETPTAPPAARPASAAAAPATATASPATAKSATNGGERRFASPLAKRVANALGIDLGQVQGSGPHGRIVKADVESAKPGATATGAATGRPTPVAPAISDASIAKLYAPGTYDVVPHDQIRKIIAKRLVEAKLTIPHFYLTVDTEIDALLKLRGEINAAAPRDEKGNVQWRVSVNDLIIKALAIALVRVPDANVTWTEGGMLHHHNVDIGVAVAIPGGLITPVVRHADEKRVSQISLEMRDYAARARNRKLAPEEYQGGSTAVSNLGMFGVKDFAAVINPPHATILAVGAGIESPVVRDGKVEIRTIMACTLSCDHRAVDGALGAKLMSAFRDLIERPAGMLA
jgi:pyruvate dehydrogenase E2 component (dihydrolipoyllysine-residue acetyltransferase)